VAEEAAVERKEVRRVRRRRRCRSGRSWQRTEGPAEVGKDVEEHQDTEIVCVLGTIDS
jgi:hypothetical protein